MPCRKLPHSATPARHQTWLFGLLLVVATVAVFAPVVHHEFVVWDDDLHVYANPRLHPVTWTRVGAFWQAPYQHLYIPLTYTAWAALTWLSQTLLPGPLAAWPFHSLNLLLHLGSTLVVYRLGLLILAAPERTDSRLAGAAAGALLFGLHPLQVEAVAWVSGLKDVLCGWWALVAIWQYLEYARSPGERRGWGHYGLAMGAYGLALLAKPAAVVVPGMAGLLAVWGLGQRWSQALRALSGWVVMAGFWGLWTKGQQPDAALGWITPLWARPLIALDAVTFYVGKLLWPVGLGPDYGRTPQVVLEQGIGSVMALLPLVLGVGLWRRRQRLGGLGSAMAVFVVGLLPVLGGLPFMFQTYSTVADRYTYLAMVGAALGLGWAVQQAGRQRLVWLGSLLLLGVLGWRSMVQVQVWQDTVTLFTHALRVNPRRALAHNNLGLVLAQQNNLDDAMAHFLTARQLQPGFPEAHYNLGKTLTLQGRLDDAIPAYLEALRLRPQWAEAHNNLGVTLAAQGKYADAMPHYAQALLLKPDWAQAHYNIGEALARLGRTAEAIAAYQAALHWRPAWSQAAAQLTRLTATQPPSVPPTVSEAPLPAWHTTQEQAVDAMP
jgi:Tfp pilus assembly protein PilF